MNRLYEVRESQPIFTTYLNSPEILPQVQRGAMPAVNTEPFETLVKFVEDMDADIATAPVLPPGVVNVQKTPRRPGAPSTPAV